MENSMDKKIRNLIFDFGGVLVDLDKQQTIKSFAELGIDVQEHIRDYVQGGPFALLESGAATPQEFLDTLRQMSSAKEKPTDEQIAEAWNRMLVRIPERRLQALKQLREHYRIFLLSNTNIIHWDYSARYLFTVQGNCAEDYFDHIYLSCDLKLMKPGKEIFQEVLRQEQLEASETLFIDDSAANCAAASALGIQTYCPAEADDWLPLFIS